VSLDRKKISSNKDAGRAIDLLPRIRQRECNYGIDTVDIHVSDKCVDNGAERQADEKNGGSNMSVKPSTMKRRSRSSDKRDQASFRKDSNWVIDIQRVCDSNGMQETIQLRNRLPLESEAFEVIVVQCVNKASVYCLLTRWLLLHNYITLSPIQFLYQL